MLVFVLLACGNSEDSPDKKHHPTPEDTSSVPEQAQDVLHTALSLDLAQLTGQAVVDVTANGPIQLDVGDLTVTEVLLNDAPVDYHINHGQLRVPSDVGTQQLSVKYGFSDSDNYEGWMASRGEIFTWPYFCGNLFPCNPDTTDGLQFNFDVQGIPEGQTAIYPSEINFDVPDYVLGLAMGDYVESVLGTTEQGTQLSVWAHPDETEYALNGTIYLVDAFNFYEKTYGPYAYGDHAGSVSVDWGRWTYGGMETHPFWHISAISLRSTEAHVHEAGHGWFGSGVRMACWEDFVLSEGTTTYITAHALESIGGPSIFNTYVDELDRICNPANPVLTVALPDTCNEIDLYNDPLFSMVPYMKGACFYEDVADMIGPEVLDEVISGFYQENVGKAASMRQMIEAIRARTTPAQSTELDSLVSDWLTQGTCPRDYAARCGQHVQRSR